MSRAARYQPEIDGLRAVAILATVLFHAKMLGLGGGFVGVDVFFVISGFLITRLLLDEVGGSGRIDFLAFYARRIRRILPALLLVVAMVLVVGAFVMSASGERQRLSREALATLGFVANIYFWRTQALYFAPQTDRSALLNMWTLSVEEQFYLVWPLLLMLTAATARRLRFPVVPAVGAVLLVLTGLSLALFVVGERSYSAAAFYLTPTRLWELALGGAVAAGEPSLHRLKRWASPVATLGVFAILIAASSVGHALPFAFAVLVAVLGAAATIAGVSVLPGSPVGRVLASRPLVGIGLVSYSWYLWHWPLLGLARLYDIGHASLARDLVVVVGALGLAALTYRLVEDPIRRNKSWPFASARQTFAAGGVLSLAVAALAVGLSIEADARLRRDPWLTALHTARSEPAQSPAGCRIYRRFYGLHPEEACRIGPSGPRPSVLLWGDSHAEHLDDLLRVDTARAGYAVLERTMSACPPALPSSQSATHFAEDCLAFNAAVAGELPALAANGLRGIVLSSRAYGFLPLADAAKAAAWQAGLRNILALARELRLRVLLVAPVATFSDAVPDCLAHRGADGCAVAKGVVDRTRAPLVAALRDVSGDNGDVRLFDLAAPLCDERACRPMYDGVIMYFDRSHLSRAGSRALAPIAAPALDWLRQ